MQRAHELHRERTGSSGTTRTRGRGGKDGTETGARNGRKHVEANGVYEKNRDRRVELVLFCGGEDDERSCWG